MAEIYHMNKQQVKKLRKKSPNDKIKKRMKQFLIIITIFMVSRPIGALFSSEEIENGTKIGSELTKDTDLTIKLTAIKGYEENALLEVNLLVDMPANKVDFELTPEVYNKKEEPVRNVEVIKVNPNFYTLFIPKTDPESFHYYIALPEKGNVLDTVNVGNRLSGFTITSYNDVQEKSFKVRSMSYYATQSRELLSLKYSDGIKILEKEQKNLRGENKNIKVKNEKLLSNAANLTVEEKEIVASQIATNNASITANEEVIKDKEKAKAPILEKIKALSDSTE